MSAEEVEVEILPTEEEAPIEVVGSPTPPDPEARGIDGVLGFFTVSGLNRGLIAGGYSVEREMESLASLACDPIQSAEIRLEAIRQIRLHLREALVLSGGIQSTQAKAERLLSDGTFQVSVTGQRLLSPQDTEHMLEQALQTTAVLESFTNSNPSLCTETSDGTTETPEAEADQGGSPGPVPNAFIRRPIRDLGGGGLCVSSQRAAATARHAAGVHPPVGTPPSLPELPGELSGSDGTRPADPGDGDPPAGGTGRPPEAPQGGGE